MCVVAVLGCAFVTLSSRQCAQNAIRSLHHSRTLEVSAELVLFVCFLYCCITIIDFLQHVAQSICMWFVGKKWIPILLESTVGMPHFFAILITNDIKHYIPKATVLEHTVELFIV